jgi:hypothetical protein
MHTRMCAAVYELSSRVYGSAVCMALRESPSILPLNDLRSVGSGRGQRDASDAHLLRTDPKVLIDTIV